MLSMLRNATRGWVAKLLLVLLVASFAIWGVSGSILSGNASSVISVGDTRVTPIELRLAYDRQLNQLQRQLGSRLTREQADAFGLTGSVISQLVGGAVLDEAGAMVTSKGVSVDELGPVMKSAPEYDVDTGEEAKPAILIEGHHVNMRAEGELAALLLRMAEEGAGEGGGRGKSVVVGARSTGIFRDTGILSLLGNVAEVTKGDTKGVPRGFKGTTGITLFDPGDVTHRARVWA